MIQRRTGIRMRGAKVRGSFKTGFRWASGGKTSKQVVILFYLTCEQDRGSVEENCQRDSGECPFGCDSESPEFQSDTRPAVTAGGQACGITLNDGVISDEEVSEELHR